MSILIAGVLHMAAAQEIGVNDSHDQILENLLKFNINVTVCSDSKKGLWDFKSTKLTIPGKAVTLKIEGKDIKIYGIFTPYISEGQLMLLAQSQVILYPGSENKVKYFNSFKTLTITLGETILFLPLGQKESNDRKANPPKDEAVEEECNIQIEIEILPYKLKEPDKEIMEKGFKSLEEEKKDNQVSPTAPPKDPAKNPRTEKNPPPLENIPSLEEGVNRELNKNEKKDTTE